MYFAHMLFVGDKILFEIEEDEIIKSVQNEFLLRMIVILFDFMHLVC